MRFSQYSLCMLLLATFILGCGGGDENYDVGEGMTKEQRQAFEDARLAVEGAQSEAEYIEANRKLEEVIKAK